MFILINKVKVEELSLMILVLIAWSMVHSILDQIGLHRSLIWKYWLRFNQISAKDLKSTVYKIWNLQGNFMNMILKCFTII